MTQLLSPVPTFDGPTFLFDVVEVHCFSTVDDPRLIASLVDLNQRGFSVRSGAAQAGSARTDSSAPQGPSDDEICDDLQRGDVFKLIGFERGSDQPIGYLTAHTLTDQLGWVAAEHRQWISGLGPLVYIASVVAEPAALGRGIGQSLVCAAGMVANAQSPGRFRMHFDYCHANREIIPAVMDAARRLLDQQLGTEVTVRDLYRGTFTWAEFEVTTFDGADAERADFGDPEPAAGRAERQHAGSTHPVAEMAERFRNRRSRRTSAGGADLLAIADLTPDELAALGLPAVSECIIFGADAALCAGASPKQTLIESARLARQLGCERFAVGLPDEAILSAAIGTGAQQTTLDTQTFVSLEISYVH